MCEKAMHMGEPISRSGLSSSISFSAVLFCSGSLKYHGLPSSSHTVKSSASAGMRPSLGCLLAASVTRGAGYTPETTAWKRFVASRRYFLLSWPKSMRRLFMWSYTSSAALRYCRV